MTERSPGAPPDVPQSPYLAHTLRRAYSLAAQRGSAYVTLEHLLVTLLDDPDALALLEGCNVDIASIRIESSNFVRQCKPVGPAGQPVEPRPSDQFKHILHTASLAALNAGKAEVDGAIVIAALAGHSDSVAAVILNENGLKFGRAISWLSEAPGIPPRARRKISPAPSPPPRQDGGPPPETASPRREHEQVPPPRTGPEPAPRHPSARSARPASSGPTLEDMLATVRDVLEDEANAADDVARDGPSARRHRSNRGEAGRAPPPRSPSPDATRARSSAGARRPQSSQAPAESLRRSPAQPAPRLRPGAPPLGAETFRSAGSGGAAAANAADRPQPRVSSGQKRGRLSEAELKLGKLVERIPREMRVGVPERVEVRIGREATDTLLAGLEGQGAATVHKVAVTRAMTLFLKAPEGGFLIESLSPETQWVFDRPSFLESEPYGQWRWTILPTARGQRKLQLVAAARSIDENGLIGDSVLPVQVIEVNVHINWKHTIQRAALWIGLVVGGGVLTEATLTILRVLAP